MKQEKPGTPREFELRDDDRSTDTSYGRPARSSTQSLAFMIVAVVLVALIVGAIFLNRDTQRPAEGRTQAIPSATTR